MATLQDFVRVNPDEAEASVGHHVCRRRMRPSSPNAWCAPRGIDTRGLQFLPWYLERVRRGLIARRRWRRALARTSSRRESALGPWPSALVTPRRGQLRNLARELARDLSREPA